MVQISSPAMAHVSDCTVIIVCCENNIVFLTDHKQAIMLIVNTRNKELMVFNVSY